MILDSGLLFWATLYMTTTCAANLVSHHGQLVTTLLTNLCGLNCGQSTCGRIGFSWGGIMTEKPTDSRFSSSIRIVLKSTMTLSASVTWIPKTKTKGYSSSEYTYCSKFWICLPSAG